MNIKRIISKCVTSNSLKTLSYISSNPVSQSLLRKIIAVAQYLMGIGAGGDVAGSGEHILFNKLKKINLPSYCIFDVGANKGQFIDLVLSNFDIDNFLIHSFEPSSSTFQTLSNNFKNHPKVKLNNFGLGKEINKFTLYSDQPGSGLASLTLRKLDHYNINFCHSETVEISTIDHYCNANNIKYVDLLKIDVEGHEMDVLAGADKMFKNKLIGMVSFEFGGCNIDTRTFFQDFFYFFQKQDMKVFRITPSGYLNLIPSYDEIDEQFRTTNYLAVSNKLEKFQ